MAAVFFTSQLLLLPPYMAAKVFLAEIDDFDEIDETDDAAKGLKGNDYASGRTPKSCGRTPRLFSTVRGPGFWIRGGSHQARVRSRTKGQGSKVVDCSKGGCFCCTRGRVGAVVHKPSKCNSGGKDKQKGMVPVCKK